MADTIRTSTELFALLADNTDGNISAQDLRDVLESLRDGHGEMYISSSAGTTPDDDATYKDIAGTYSLVAGAHNWDMNSNGQLRYTGVADRHVHIWVALSMSTASNNQVLNFRIAKNGDSIAHTTIGRKTGTGSPMGAAALFDFSTVSTNDYITVQIRNTSGANAVTIDFMTVIAHDGID